VVVFLPAVVQQEAQEVAQALLEELLVGGAGHDKVSNRLQAFATVGMIPRRVQYP